MIKIGVVDKAHLYRFERISTYLWLTCICLDLYEIGKQNNIMDLIVHNPQNILDSKSKDHYQACCFVKLVGDLGFCVYDLLMIENSRTQAMFGFISAYMGLMKLIIKARKSLIKSGG